MKLPLDPHFVAATQWNAAFERDVRASGDTATQVVIGLLRHNQAVVRQTLHILPGNDPRNFTYVERRLKALCWAYGGHRILIDGPSDLVKALQQHYAQSPTGQLDSELIGEKIYGAPISVEAARAEEIPEAVTDHQAIGRHLDGCRIGFDLGGSDRKCAALIDGEGVFSEEIKWDPYFQTDPEYHFDGIMDSLRRAAAHLPRVDAIGGSAAGVYVDNEVRVASLFRGVGPDDFNTRVRPIFHRVREAWDGIPFVVINDGEVTALAGAMSLNVSALLGVSLGTSTAAGYVTPAGTLTTWLNELAFVPVDYRPDGPVDEWSGDVGCAVQFFSQQGVARLAKEAGWDFDAQMPLAERLVAVQDAMKQDDPRARAIFSTIGVCFGHTIAHWTSLYTIQHLLILGRVTSGAGGDLILDCARTTLQEQYPSLAEQMALHIPDEKMKRHGQAVAAASLPAISKESP